MTIELHEMTIKDSVVRDKLLEYLEKVKRYPGFDYSMMLRIFVDDNKDFTAFESIKYRIQFTSYAHKIIDTIKSRYIMPDVSFTTFYEAIKRL